MRGPVTQVAGYTPYNLRFHRRNCHYRKAKCHALCPIRTSHLMTYQRWQPLLVKGRPQGGRLKPFFQDLDYYIMTVHHAEQGPREFLDCQTPTLKFHVPKLP